MKTQNHRKAAVASLIGTTVEYYDFFIFGTAAALVFPQLFFPTSTPVAGTLLAFATLGVGFLARPLGSVVFGHFGDKIGRKQMLIISLSGMGLATFLMGLLPTHAQIGVAAPILLTLLRLLQGFMVGGEWGGATLMAVEHAPANKRGFYGSFPQTGAPAGVALATVVFLAVAQLPDEAFLSWGWRVPFLVSIVLVAIGMFIRLSVAESPTFVAARKKHVLVKVPVVEAFRLHSKEIFITAGIYLSQGIFAYITMSYLVNYGTTVVQIDRTHALLGVFIGALIQMVLCPLFGALSDRIGRKTVYLMGAAAMGISIGPAFMLINTGNPWNFTLAIILAYGISMAPAAGVTGTLFAMAFSPQVRYTGASVGYTISQLCGSAFAPMIATALWASTGSSNSIVIYMVIASLISVLSVIALPGAWGAKERAQQLGQQEATESEMSDSVSGQ
ncbi:MAG: MFS transporter [Paeniglutamicibacter terrestris]